MPRGGHVYILTNAARTVLYTGVTSDLPARLEQHRTGQYDGFTKRYKTHLLVYCDWFPDIREAIDAEKQIKAGSRKKKIQLIEQANPKWRDLSDEVF